MAIKGGPIGSIKKLKAAVARGGSEGRTERIKDGGTLVRFLTEPDQWYGYFEHFDDVNKFYPCSDDCPGCAVGDKPSQRFLANVVMLETGQVVPLVLPKQLAQRLTKKYERYGTLTDRDYELLREGTGFETEYDVEPDDPSNIKLSKYTLLDLGAVLEAQLASQTSGDADDDDDEDDEPRRSMSARRAANRKGTKARRSLHNRVTDDDDDDDDSKPARRPLKKPGQARREKEAATRAEAAKRQAAARKGTTKGTSKSAAKPAAKAAKKRPTRR